jgi:hypothetical protein
MSEPGCEGGALEACRREPSSLAVPQNVGAYAFESGSLDHSSQAGT